MQTMKGRKGHYILSINLCFTLFAIGCVPLDEQPESEQVTEHSNVELDPTFWGVPELMDDGGTGMHADPRPEDTLPEEHFPDLPGDVITPEEPETEPETDPETDPEEDPEALLLKACGDGIIQTQNGEQCDPGLNAGPQGDGCNERCQVEHGFICEGEPSVCWSKCGDGQLAINEACDDGNLVDGDGCNTGCGVEAGFECTNSPSFCAPLCGDGLQRGGETCDDGNNADYDGCGSQCDIETGFTCMHEGFPCETVCGDGQLVGYETCDDGNNIGGDGCDTQCHVESGFVCQLVPSECALLEEPSPSVCGDSIIDEFNAESCDDGNNIPGDGCSETCLIETGFSCIGAPSVCNVTNI